MYILPNMTPQRYHSLLYYLLNAVVRKAEQDILGYQKAFKEQWISNRIYKCVR